MDIEALSMGNARTLSPQWYAYALAEGYVGYDKFFPICFSFLLVFLRIGSSFFLTFYNTFFSTLSAQSLSPH